MNPKNRFAQFAFALGLASVVAYIVFVGGIGAGLWGRPALREYVQSRGPGFSPGDYGFSTAGLQGGETEIEVLDRLKWVARNAESFTPSRTFRSIEPYWRGAAREYEIVHDAGTSEEFTVFFGDDRRSELLLRRVSDYRAKSGSIFVVTYFDLVEQKEYAKASDLFPANPDE